MNESQLNQLANDSWRNGYEARKEEDMEKIDRLKQQILDAENVIQELYDLVLTGKVPNSEDIKLSKYSYFKACEEITEVCKRKGHA